MANKFRNMGRHKSKLLMKYHLTLVRMAIAQKTVNDSARKDADKRAFHVLLAATTKNKMKVIQETSRINICSTYSAPVHIPKDSEST